MDSPDSPRPSPGRFPQLRLRLRTFWAIKMVGTTAGMSAFFAAYFWLLHHPAFPVTVMPVTAIDRLVGFQPAALPIYLSLWFYVSLVPALLIDRRELVAYASTATLLSVAGLGIFFFWPTAVPRLDINWSEHSAFRFLEKVDASGNACPSLHAAFTAFTAVWLTTLLRQMTAGRLAHAINWLWCLGILYSTIATRQHVVLDLLAGTALGLVVAGLHRPALRLLPVTAPQ